MFVAEVVYEGREDADYIISLQVDEGKPADGPTSRPALDWRNGVDFVPFAVISPLSFNHLLPNGKQDFCIMFTSHKMEQVIYFPVSKRRCVRRHCASPSWTCWLSNLPDHITAWHIDR